MPSKLLYHIDNCSRVHAAHSLRAPCSVRHIFANISLCNWQLRRIRTKTVDIVSCAQKPHGFHPVYGHVCPAKKVWWLVAQRRCRLNASADYHVSAPISILFYWSSRLMKWACHCRVNKLRCCSHCLPLSLIVVWCMETKKLSLICPKKVSFRRCLTLTRVGLSHLKWLYIAPNAITLDTDIDENYEERTMVRSRRGRQ